MKLTVKCTQCSNQILVKENVSDRAELAQLRGDSLTLNCHKCLHIDNYSVNQIKAKESKKIALVASLILFIGTLVIGYLLLLLVNINNLFLISGILLIPSIIYAILHKQEQDNVRRFNRYYT